MDNYFFVYRWATEDIPFVLYTERELRKIHRTFGNPPIKATDGFLGRYVGGMI